MAVQETNRMDLYLTIVDIIILWLKIFALIYFVKFIDDSYPKEVRKLNLPWEACAIGASCWVGISIFISLVSNLTGLNIPH